jgi:hypothetical protein
MKEMEEKGYVLRESHVLIKAGKRDFFFFFSTGA